MPIICREQNLLFIMTPRTACTAIGKVLCDELGGEYFPSESILGADGKARVRTKHATLQDLLDNDLITKEEISSFLVFGGVRNPFDSLVSLYIKKRHTYQPLLSDPNSWVYKISPGYVEDMKFCLHHSFDEWVDKNHRQTLVKRLMGRGRRSMFERYTKDVDAIVRFENLQDDFRSILKLAEIPTDHSVPLHNKTREKQRGYQDYYSDQSKKIVEYVFRDDIEKYGYSF